MTTVSDLLQKHAGFAQLMGTASGFFGAKLVLTAVELGLFTTLGRQSMTGEEIGRALALHSRGIWDFLDALVALGFLERAGDGPAAQYENTEVTAHYLDKSEPTYIGSLLEMWNDRAYKFWGDLGVALTTGQAQNEVKHSRKGMFDALYEDPVRLEQFTNSMAVLSRKNFEVLAEKFDLCRYRTLCDVGGATGLLARVMAQRYPHIQCTTFDLPQVEPIAKTAVEKDRLADRVRVKSGDFFKDGIPHADVITMGMILHDWNLEKKKRLVRLAYDALPKGGAFIVIETLIDDARRENAGGLINSLQMMLEFGDAFDFTGADFWSWCKEAGFERYETMHLTGAFSAAIAYK